MDRDPDVYKAAKLLEAASTEALKYLATKKRGRTIATDGDVAEDSYETAQRVEADHNRVPSPVVDPEIDRLKMELERVSEQFLDMEKNKQAQTSKRKPDVATGLQDKSFKSSGVQADPANHASLSTKLFDIRPPSSYQDPRRDFNAELLLSCSADLGILSSFNEMSMQSSKALESEKVINLAFAMTKISSGSACLKTLVEPLLVLCKAENAVLVHSSLRVLHVLLEHIFAFEISLVASSCDIPQLHGSKESSKKSQQDTDNYANLHSLFKLMNQIASRRTEGDVKQEAVSIMNMIVERTDAYTERETFASKEVFVSIILLIKNEAGLRVRTEAIQLFYSLLNCPTIYDRIGSVHEEKESPLSGNNNKGSLFALEAFSIVLEDLAECLTSPRNTSEDLELCQSVIRILALVALSGDSSYKILLLSQKLPQDTNFLVLILHLLAAETDSESKAEIYKARILLTREILRLLNSLVSDSSSRSIILSELTNDRDMKRLTLDAARRLSGKRNVSEEGDSEITKLGCIFKKQVCTFLGVVDLS